MYNASNRIEMLLDALQESVAQFSFRVILVDDFSTDKTVAKVRAIQAKYSFEIELIRLAKNYGQHCATTVGFSQVKGDFCITIDDDLQHYPKEMNKLIARYLEKDCDLIYGQYLKKKHSFLRNLGSKLLKLIMRSSNHKLINITSYRLVKTEILKPFRTNAVPVVFLDEYLINYAADVEFVPVEHFSRDEGKSNYSYRKLVQFAVHIVLFHSSLPLRFITRLGIWMSLIFFAIGCFFIWQKIYSNIQIGFTSIIVSIFFSSGLILFALGTIGEYIRKIWFTQQQLNNLAIRSDETFKR